MLLDDGHGVEGVLLSLLGVDLADEVDQVRLVLLGLGPLALGQQLVRQTALLGAADAEDAVVVLVGRQALEGELDCVALLGDEVVGPVKDFLSAIDAVGRRLEVWASNLELKASRNKLT